MANLLGQEADASGKCSCKRCGKKMAQINFYTYKDGSKCQMCKPCLTAHIDNFNPDTYLWILEKMDVPYIPSEWNVLRNKAFAKDPKKMNGMSVIGKYLAKMKLKQWNQYCYADTERLQKEAEDSQVQKTEEELQEQKKFEAELKEKFQAGEISEAEYQTLENSIHLCNKYMESFLHMRRLPPVNLRTRSKSRISCPQTSQLTQAQIWSKMIKCILLLNGVGFILLVSGLLLRNYIMSL